VFSDRNVACMLENIQSSQLDSVPYRIFRMGTLSCSEGKGHTFESFRARHFGTELGTPNRPALEAATSVRSSTLFDP